MANLKGLSRADAKRVRGTYFLSRSSEWVMRLPREAGRNRRSIRMANARNAPTKMIPAIQIVLLSRGLWGGTTTPLWIGGTVDEDAARLLTAGEKGADPEPEEASLVAADFPGAERGWGAGAATAGAVALGLGCSTTTGSGFRLSVFAVSAFDSTNGAMVGNGLMVVSSPCFSGAARLVSALPTLDVGAESPVLAFKDSGCTGAIFSASVFLPDRISGAAITG